MVHLVFCLFLMKLVRFIKKIIIAVATGIFHVLAVAAIFAIFAGIMIGVVWSLGKIALHYGFCVGHGEGNMVLNNGGALLSVIVLMVWAVVVCVFICRWVWRGIKWIHKTWKES